MEENNEGIAHTEGDAEMKDQEAYDSSSDSSDSSDSSGDEAGHSTLDDYEVDRLEMQVQANPYDFGINTKYINSLRAHGLSQRVREAREAMSAKFPLTEDLWVDWVRDEERLAESDEDKESVVALYERAVKDYLSIPLWASFCSFIEQWAFSTSPLPSTAMIKRVRDTYEKGLAAGGLHVREGSRLWNSYRTFEQRVLSAMAETSNEGERAKQIQTIRGLYTRQLGVPLLGMENTFKDYEQWEESLGPTAMPPKNNQALTTKYQAALEQLNVRKPFEERIAGSTNPTNPDYSKIPDWKEYLDVEMKQKDPARIQCLYERMIKGYCLVLDVWKDYLRYLEKSLSKLHRVVLSVYERSVRNCYWSGDLWASYIRALERAGQHDQISAVFERGVVAGLTTPEDHQQLFNSMVDFEKRSALVQNGATSTDKLASLRALLQRSVDHFSQNFPDSGIASQMERYWAGLEARQLGNMEEARRMFVEITKKSPGEYALWNDYITIERYLGDANKARTLFKRAFQSVIDDPARVWSDWLTFEREQGTLEQWEAANEAIREKAEEMRRRTEEERAVAAMLEEEKRKKRLEHDQKRKIKHKEMRKRGADESQEHTSAKRQKTTEQTQGEFAAPHVPSPSIHVTNLPFSLTEEQLQELFSEVGQIKAVRLIKDQEGRSRGFAFIDFMDDETANAALALNGREVNGRKLVVDRADAGHAQKPSEYDGAPQNRPPKIIKPHNDALTTFVTNLSFNATEKDIRETFGKAGSIKQIRLVKDNKTGKSKGYAYIEFEDEQSLNNALELNQQSLLGRPMNVVRSNPPKADTSTAPPPAVETPKEQRTPKQTQMMVPRTMRPRALVKPTTTTTTTETEKDTNETNETKPTPMSNQDFKKMLLQGK